MALGEKRFDELKVTWPVKFEWTVLSGAEHVTTKVSGASGEMLELEWKTGEANLSECTEIQVAAHDQYGHTPSSSFKACGGLMGDELSLALLEQAKMFQDALKKLHEHMKKMKATTQKRVINKPIPEPDPYYEAVAELYYGLKTLDVSMRGKAGVRSYDLLRTITNLTPAVATLRARDASFLQAHGLDTLLYIGSPAQKSALDAVRGKLSSRVVDAYAKGFASMGREQAAQLLPRLGARRPVRRNTVGLDGVLKELPVVKPTGRGASGQ